MWYNGLASNSVTKLVFQMSHVYLATLLRLHDSNIYNLLPTNDLEVLLRGCTNTFTEYKDKELGGH